MRWEQTTTYEEDSAYPDAKSPNNDDTWELVSAVRFPIDPWGWVLFWKRPKEEQVRIDPPSAHG